MWRRTGWHWRTGIGVVDPVCIAFDVAGANVDLRRQRNEHGLLLSVIRSNNGTGWVADRLRGYPAA
jgi:hypothetical protein